MMVSHHDHHRHSAYVLGHVDAAGFSQSQQRRLAELVLGQRGSLRKLDARLGEQPFIWQVLALRLAIILCHARVAVDDAGIQLRASGRTVRLHVPQPWAERRPRTLYLLDEEAHAWSLSGALRLSVRQSEA